MSQETSPSTGRRYGVQRVCAIAGMARSSYYERQRRERLAPPLKKRGPKPFIPDDRLLELIREDLKNSPFVGEGHRKVWARLKFSQGVRASRKRVLRLMRENHLLSPYRRFQGQAKTHDGRIVTDGPNEMWGADGTKVLTVEDGYVWIFTAVEHWNAECVGWHVAKHGNRFAALEPVTQAVRNQFGSVERGCVRGLSLRTDHGSQYTSDDFQNQLKAWGIVSSFAFLKEPETNGVAERFFRTLKEQVIYGRTFRNAEELREAVGKFVGRYNQSWRPEKNGFLSPLEMREAPNRHEAA